MKAQQIFRAGRFVAMNGETYDFSKADVEKIAAAYDPNKYEAPFVVGHPKTDDPAYGWTKSLSAVNGVLHAEPDQVHPDFAEMVNAGRFKKISASLYAPNAPANPVKGGYYLRHVGFLGAAPPAVKGLKNAEFSDAHEGVIEFSEDAETANRRKARPIIPRRAEDIEYERKQIELAEADRKSQETQMTDQEKNDLAAREKKVKDDAAALATQQTEFAEREKKFKAEEKKQKDKAITDFVEAQVKAGKVLPANKESLIAFASSLDAAATIEFGEGDKKQKQSGLEYLKSYIAGQPKLVEFSEKGKGEQEAEELTDPTVIAQKAIEFQEAEAKKGHNINIAQAVEHVSPAKAQK